MGAARDPWSKLGRISLGCGIAAWGFALAPAAARVLIGHELDCFPGLLSPLQVVWFVALPSIAGAFGCTVADAVLNNPRLLRRFIGGTLALAMPLLWLTVEPIRVELAFPYGFHTDYCNCEPAGLLGQFPDGWRTLQRVAGREGRAPPR